jgi:hypothetical protein
MSTRNSLDEGVLADQLPYRAFRATARLPRGLAAFERFQLVDHAVERRDGGVQSQQQLRRPAVQFCPRRAIAVGNPDITKGSNANYLRIEALDDGKVGYSEIQPVYLVHADARSAFASSNINAWSISDPYLAVANRCRRRLAVEQVLRMPDAIDLRKNWFDPIP